MAAILVPGVDPRIDAELRKRWGLKAGDPVPISAPKMMFSAGAAPTTAKFASRNGTKPIAPPTPGWSKAKLEEALDKTVARTNFRKKDFFSVPAIENRVELFERSVPGAKNDVKAQIDGAEASGNFLFGAEAAASGLSTTEALLWARAAQIYQDAKAKRWPSWQDNPGDADKIKEGHRYFHQRYRKAGR